MCTSHCLQTDVSRVVYVSMYHFPKMELTLISKKKVLEDYIDSSLKNYTQKKYGNSMGNNVHQCSKIKLLHKLLAFISCLLLFRIEWQENDICICWYEVPYWPRYILNIYAILALREVWDSQKCCGLPNIGTWKSGHPSFWKKKNTQKNIHCHL